MRKNIVQRKSFSKISSAVEIPDLLEIQLKSYRDFLQDDLAPNKRKIQGLQEAFVSLFPITDSRESYLLEFVEYYVESPKYNVDECRERGMTYALPLKAKLRLSVGTPIVVKRITLIRLSRLFTLGIFPI